MPFSALLEPVVTIQKFHRRCTRFLRLQSCTWAWNEPFLFRGTTCMHSGPILHDHNNHVLPELSAEQALYFQRNAVSSWAHLVRAQYNSDDSTASEYIHFIGKNEDRNTRDLYVCGPQMRFIIYAWLSYIAIMNLIRPNHSNNNKPNAIFARMLKHMIGMFPSDPLLASIFACESETSKQVTTKVLSDLCAKKNDGTTISLPQWDAIPWNFDKLWAMHVILRRIVNRMYELQVAIRSQQQEEKDASQEEHDSLFAVSLRMLEDMHDHAPRHPLYVDSM